MQFTNCPFSQGKEGRYGEVDRSCDTISCALWDRDNRCCHLVSISAALQEIASGKSTPRVSGGNGKPISGGVRL